MDIHRIITTLAVTATLGVAACGTDTADTDKLEKQATELTKSAEQTAKDIQSGKADPVAAAEQLQDEAADTAGSMVDELQSDDRLPDEAKAQLDAAEEQLEALEK